MLVGATSWAGDAFGVWKLNQARSALTANQRSVTLRIEPHTRGEVFTLDDVAVDGRVLTSSTILYFDGKARSFQDSVCSGTQSSRRLDGRTVEILRTCTSSESTRLIRLLAVQSRDLTFDITEQFPDGRGFQRRLVLEKEK
jgi:hypothetical protein